MRRCEVWPAILPFFLAVGLALIFLGPGRAAEGNTYIIAATEGYGVEDCLAEGGECGRVVADAWCEAHGHGAALSLGIADDVTNAISSVATVKPASPYIVRCGE